MKFFLMKSYAFVSLFNIMATTAPSFTVVGMAVDGEEKATSSGKTLLRGGGYGGGVDATVLLVVSEEEEHQQRRLQFSNAIELTSGTTVHGDTSGATTSTAPACGSTSEITNPVVWYKFLGTGNKFNIYVTTDDDEDVNVVSYDENFVSCNEILNAGASLNGGGKDVSTNPGVTYYIAVTGQCMGFVAGQFAISLNEIIPEVVPTSAPTSSPSTPPPTLAPTTSPTTAPTSSPTTSTPSPTTAPTSGPTATSSWSKKGKKGSNGSKKKTGSSSKVKKPKNNIMKP